MPSNWIDEVKQKGYGYKTLEELLMDNGCAITKQGIVALKKWMDEYRRLVNLAADERIDSLKRDIRAVIEPRQGGAE